MENLNHKVTYAHCRLLVGLRGKKPLCNLYNLFGVANFQDFLVAQENEVFQCCGPVEQEEHVFAPVDKVQ